MDIPDVIALSLICIWVYRHLKGFLQSRFFWRTALFAMLALWAAAVAAVTLLLRTPDQCYELTLIPLQSYIDLFSGGNHEILRSCFMNTILFVPGGLLLTELFPWPRCRKLRLCAAVLLLTAVSFGIEYCQFRNGLGHAQTDDVLHNSLGALLGALVSLNIVRKDNA